MTEPTPSFDSVSVAAILMQRRQEERADLLADLVTMLPEVVPGAEVERALLRRRVTAIRLPLGEFVYVLERGKGGSLETSRQHRVRGVVIRTDPMDIDAFLAELGLAIDAELQRTERGRDALRAWLGSIEP